MACRLSSAEGHEQEQPEWADPPASSSLFRVEPGPFGLLRLASACEDRASEGLQAGRLVGLATPEPRRDPQRSEPPSHGHQEAQGPQQPSSPGEAEAACSPTPTCSMNSGIGVSSAMLWEKIGLLIVPASSSG